jgi:hypothetical protein
MAKMAYQKNRPRVGFSDAGAPLDKRPHVLKPSFQLLSRIFGIYSNEISRNISVTRPLHFISDRFENHQADLNRWEYRWLVYIGMIGALPFSDAVRKLVNEIGSSSE